MLFLGLSVPGEVPRCSASVLVLLAGFLNSARLCRPFWGPLAAILDFVGSAALQAVRRCRRCGVAGGDRVPPLPLGWYFK